MVDGYKSDGRKYLAGEPCIQEHSFEHCNSVTDTGLLENVTVTFIDKTYSQNPEKKENYWIHTLKTMEPWGVNILKTV